jgi:hypothetical protein
MRRLSSIARMFWQSQSGLLALTLMGVASLSAQASGRASARAVHLQIETERSEYHVGDIIRVRVTVHNTSGAAVEYVSQPPTSQARLRVLAADGHRLPAGPSGAAQDLPSTRPVTLPAGGHYALSWLGKEWLDLRDWGYDLRTPGQYTIVGVPGVGGPNLRPDFETVRSNRARIRISP